MKSRALDKTILPLEEIAISGLPFAPLYLPPGLRFFHRLGVVAAAGVEIESRHLDVYTGHPRVIEAMNGDFLLFYPAGPMHYVWTEAKSQGNVMLMRRSSDRGATWSAPARVWESTYGQHAAILLRPREGRRIYAIGTEAERGFFFGGENSAIASRFSDDDGYTWSPPTIIVPSNAPDFRGMSAMRMDEGADGTWLVGSHAGTWLSENEVVTSQFLLRSRDQGHTWDLLPDARGWQTPGFSRMDEGRPLHLGDNRWLFIARTPEGHLWTIRSEDGGDTWSPWESTGLRHLDAPPMLFHLRDKQTLVAFIHNRRREDNAAHVFAHELRSELWVVTSTNEGRTWSEPRWLLANACEAPIMNGWEGCSPMVSYADLLTDGDTLHLFVDHQMRQILHLRFSESDLAKFPTMEQMRNLSARHTLASA